LLIALLLSLNSEKEEKMKKLLVLTAVITFVVALSGFVWAVDPKNTGCGLGSIAWEGQNGLMSQTCAATTNGTFGNQTFGITSGTSNCEQYSTFTENRKLKTYVADNMDNLARDIARGHGEYLNTLAVLMEVPDAKKPTFRSQLQVHFPDIYTSDKVTYSEVLQNIQVVAETI
jgi:Protein of unknown function (DUF3015)